MIGCGHVHIRYDLGGSWLLESVSDLFRRLQRGCVDDSLLGHISIPYCPSDMLLAFIHPLPALLFIAKLSHPNKDGSRV